MIIPSQLFERGTNFIHCIIKSLLITANVLRLMPLVRFLHRAFPDDSHTFNFVLYEIHMAILSFSCMFHLLDSSLSSR